MSLKASICTQQRPLFLPMQSTERDKVFIRDLILPVYIGVWSEEKGVAQKVRFTVELSFVGPQPSQNDVDPAISYDFILEGIRAVISKGHIRLVETLAERIASHCLSHPQSADVSVTVEKIERVAGVSLGCRIFRSKV